MRPHLLVQAQETAARGGLNLFGLVDAARFDACQPREQRVARHLPACGTIVVLGTGGRAFWLQYAQANGNGPAPASPDGFAAAALRGVADLLTAAKVRCEAIALPASPGWSTGRLGECAGFGTVSPVSGLLLHPDYGPWLQVRGVVLVEGQPFGPIRDASISERFQPCCACPRPCVTACPAGVHDGLGHQDLAACGSHRHAGGCDTVCSSRNACPLGSEHRDGFGEAAHRHGYQLATMQRWFGFGVWRFVPAFLRQGR